MKKIQRMIKIYLTQMNLNHYLKLKSISQIILLIDESVLYIIFFFEF
jgi:hypothetical protein